MRKTTETVNRLLLKHKRLALFLGVIALLSFAIAPAAKSQFFGGGSGTINQLDQFKATTSPYAAITTNVHAKNLYLPFSWATTSGSTATTFCLTGDTCITTWPSGGPGATSAYEIATTTDVAVPQLAYFTKAAGITTLGSVATTTLTATSPLSLSQPISVIGPSASALTISTAGDWTGTLDGFEAAAFEQGLTAGDGLTRTVNDFDCDTASGSVFGCLTSTDWNTFNDKLSAAVTAIGPVAQTSDGPTVTFATSSDTNIGLTITGSGDTQTFTSNWIGTLANARLTNSTVSYGGVTLSLGGTDATPAFDLTDATLLPIVAGTTGTLSIARGGTATTTAYDGGLFFYDSSLGTFSQASRASSNFNLNWDRTTPGLGIGTTTPWGLLSVNANALTAGVPQFVVGSSTLTNFIVANNGRVGVSTTSPGTLLAVGGNVLIGAPTAGGTNGTLTYGGVTAANTVTGTGSLVLGTSPTFTTQITAPLVYGGSAVGSTLTLRATSGAGVGAEQIIFGVRNAGNLEIARMNIGGFGVGTTTPEWGLQIASSTRPQLALSDGSLTSDHWTMRSAGNNFYLSTSSPLTFASSTVGTLNNPFSIIRGGIAGLFGFGSSSPWASVGITDTPGIASFAIGSSTRTTFMVDALGRTLFSTTTGPTAGYAAVASSTLVSYENRVATSSTTDIPFGAGNQTTVRMGSAAMTLTFSQLWPGAAQTIKICNPNQSVGGALTWPNGGTLLWDSGTVPTQITTADKCWYVSCRVSVGTSSVAKADCLKAGGTTGF